MRRLIASLALVAFVVASVAPVFAACRMRTAQSQCCCEPLPANALGEPDCCQRVKAARPLADLARHTRAFHPLTDPPVVLTVAWISSGSAALPFIGSQVGLHQRAAPRLPLRI
jgi:hypothetical protein